MTDELLKEQGAEIIAIVSLLQKKGIITTEEFVIEAAEISRQMNLEIKEIRASAWMN
jgi:hypothetical protein